MPLPENTIHTPVSPPTGTGVRTAAGGGASLSTSFRKDFTSSWDRLRRA